MDKPVGVGFGVLALCAGLSIAGAALAMGGSSGGSAPPQPSGGGTWPKSTSQGQPKPDEYDQAVKLIKEDKCADALPLLEKAAQKSPKDADIYNYLGFCQRTLGKLDDAFGNYKTALTIDPNHRGARNYVGILFLMMNRPDLADQQLDQLKKLCGNCEEKSSLEKAIADYKTAHPAPAPKSN